MQKWARRTLAAAALLIGLVARAGADATVNVPYDNQSWPHLDFGSVQVNTDAVETLYIYNTSDRTATIVGGDGISPDDYHNRFLLEGTAIDPHMQIPSHETRSVRIHFDPLQPGSYTDKLTIVTDFQSPIATSTVILTGQAVPPPAPPPPPGPSQACFWIYGESYCGEDGWHSGDPFLSGTVEIQSADGGFTQYVSVPAAPSITQSGVCVNLPPGDYYFTLLSVGSPAYALSYTQIGPETLPTGPANDPYPVIFPLCPNGQTNPGPIVPPVVVPPASSLSVADTVATIPWGVHITDGPAGYPLGITGSGFGSSRGQVFFGNLPAQVTSWTDSAIQVTIPSAPSYPYTGPVSVMAANGQRATGPSFTIRAPVQPSPGPSGLPPGWDSMDIGPGLPGSVAVNVDGSWTLKGSGADIWGQADAFRYAYTPMGGDFSVTCRVNSQTNTDWWAKVGVMIRDGLQPGSRQLMLVRTPGWGVNLQWRRVSDGDSSTAGNNLYPGDLPIWLQVQRRGGGFTAFVSRDGTNWDPVGSTITISMSDQVYAGVAITAHNASRTCVANVDHVSVSPGVSPPGGAGVSVPAVPGRAR